MQDPGYTETDTIVQVQTDLWSTGPDDGRLVWSGTLRTLEAINQGSAVRAVNEEILPELQKQGVFPARTR